jgi:hypothetical protein
MTLDGIGVSVIPPVVIEGELSRGELRLVEPEVSLPELAFTCSFGTTPDCSPVSPLARLACKMAEEDRLARAPVRLSDTRPTSRTMQNDNFR